MSAFFGLVKYAGLALLIVMAVLVALYGLAAIGAAISPSIGLFGLYHR